MIKKIRPIKFIGIGIFAFIISRIDITNFFGIWRNIDISPLLSAILIMIVLTIAQAVKWKYILQFFSISVMLRESIRIFWVGTFIGMVTPGRFGDILKMYFIGGTKHSRLKIFIGTVLDRFTDLFILGIVGLVSALIIFKWRLNLLPYLIVFFLFCALVFLAFDRWLWLNRFIQKTLDKYLPPLSKAFRELNYENILSGWRQADKGAFGLALLMLFISWIIYFISRYFLLMSLGLPLSFFEMIASVSISSLIALLPIGINGIGTRDVSMVYLFSLYGLPAEQAVAFSMLILVTDSFIVVFGVIPFYRLSSQFSLNLKDDLAKLKESFYRG